jgi:hypothetical protein
MHESGQLVGACRYYRARLDQFASFPPPPIPDAGKREQGSAINLKVVGLFSIGQFLPLIEPIRDYEATSVPERITERRFFCDRLRPRVYQKWALAGFFGPVGN